MKTVLKNALKNTVSDLKDTVKFISFSCLILLPVIMYAVLILEQIIPGKIGRISFVVWAFIYAYFISHLIDELYEKAREEKAMKWIKKQFKHR